MFNFLKKKDKEEVEGQETQMKKRRYPTPAQESIYEVAIEFINDMEGILSRYTYWLAQLGKDQTEEEKAHIAWINERDIELGKEKNKLDLYNEAQADKVIKTYGPLIKEYFETPGYDKDVAERGLPEKYVTTKVDYSEFETQKSEG